MTGSSVAVVVAAHGSRAEAANSAHRDVVAALADQVAPPVTAAFLELAAPSIDDAIDQAVARGANTVLVLPYFLYPGRHLTEDLPRIVADASERHAGSEIRLLPLFGADPALVDLLAAQVDSGAALNLGPIRQGLPVMDRVAYRLLLVRHGPDLTQGAPQWASSTRPRI